MFVLPATPLLYVSVIHLFCHITDALVWGAQKYNNNKGLIQGEVQGSDHIEGSNTCHCLQILKQMDFAVQIKNKGVRLTHVYEYEYK